MKTLSRITPFPTCFRSGPLLRPPGFAFLNFKFCRPLRSSASISVSPVSSLPAREHGADEGDSLPLVHGKSLQGPSPNKFLQVVLVSPQVNILEPYFLAYPSSSASHFCLMLSLADSWKYWLYCEDLCCVGHQLASCWGS